MQAPTARNISFISCSVCLFLIHGSSQLLKNTFLQKQKEQKCWGNLKGRSCAMYRNHDDSKSSLQASSIGKQNLVMFRLLLNFWHLRPCDCNGVSVIPIFSAVNNFALVQHLNKCVIIPELFNVCSLFSSTQFLDIFLSFRSCTEVTLSLLMW